MSGHSKWSTIKHKKGKEDAKRGKVFTKIIKEISVAARQGGGDVNSNPRLRSAVLAAKAANMPKDNIDRAIKKGTGELPGAAYEEVVYEGYGPGGVAIMLDVLTDNRNRTVAEIRHIFDKYGGAMGQAGCVSYLFDKKGNIIVDASSVDEDTLIEVALESGADDVAGEEGVFEIYTDPHKLVAVKEALEAKGMAAQSAEVAMVPKSSVPVTGKDAQQLLKIMELLEDHDDVQHVYANFDMDTELVEQLASQ